ncbi:MAG: N-acetyl-gamma-glutamyl-phosphate reductase [Microbacteriaceae bacterium]|nr:N-acetyl-gamma-glutamyl-phosphate reductase [Microbacteriaceae bacterium]
MVYSVAIAGASGYVGGELLRLISKHPQLQLKTVTANSNAGEKVSSLHPHLATFADLVFQPTDAATLSGHDIVFLALPHTKSAEVAAWLDESTLVLDCGADFRLESASVHSDGTKQRQLLRNTRRVAVPGCNVTAITLALAPLVRDGLIETDDIVAVLSVGTSGAGRAPKPSLLASEILAGASAYGVGGTHRHTPEIEQNLRKSGGADVKISFTPVLVPMTRGILAVNTATAKSGTSLGQILDSLNSAYASEEFIQVLPEGVLPNTSSTLGVNTCLISATVDAHSNRVVLVSAIDNLVKGTAGAAIQSMNLALGLEETLGLEIDGVAP